MSDEKRTPDEFPEVTISGEMAFQLTMSSKNLDRYFKDNPQMVKSRDVEKINYCRHILKAFSRFYNEALLQKDSVPLPEELETLSFMGPASSRYVVCTQVAVDSCAEVPTGGVGYAWCFLNEWGENVGDPVMCTDSMPSGFQLTDEKARDRRDYNWLFTLPERRIIEGVN